MIDAQPSHPTAPVTRQDLFALLGALGAMVTVATATLYYFGWRRSEIQAAAMEMDVTLFGFSTQDYVLRGLSSLYAPALVLAALAVGALLTHQWLTRAVETLGARGAASVARVLRHVEIGAAIVATACVAYTWEGAGAKPRAPVEAVARTIGTWRWTVPALLVFATLLGSYAAWHRRRLAGRIRPTSWSTVATSVVITTVVALGLFWVLEDYAGTIARRNAALITQQVTSLPRATVTSPTALHITAPGVTETPTPDGYFTIVGLRLLARSGGKVVLLHDGWSPTTGTVVVLADTDELVWQFSR